MCLGGDTHTPGTLSALMNIRHLRILSIHRGVRTIQDFIDSSKCCSRALTDRLLNHQRGVKPSSHSVQSMLSFARYEVNQRDYGFVLLL